MQTLDAGFLTPEELKFFRARHLLGKDPSRTGPFRIDLNAEPLASIAQSAFRGVGVYEFMSLRRPGDMLRYLRVEVIDIPDLARRRLAALSKIGMREALGARPPAPGLWFTEFDSAFWCRERFWWDEEDEPFVHAWVEFMRSPYWLALCHEFLSLVEGIQARLRDEGDELTQHELSAMARRRHRRDFWPRSESIGTGTPSPSSSVAIPPAVFEMFLKLVAERDVKSVSCCWKDLKIWRALALEQRRRANALGVPPGEALGLAGPDSGLYEVPLEDWDADVHIPYEGCREGDVFVVPTWLRFDLDAAEEDDSVRSGFHGKASRYVISPRPLGTFRRERCHQFGDWAVYVPL